MSDSSASLFARAQLRIPGGVNSPVRAFRGVGGTPFFTVRADGCRLYTADGRELIDYVCTWGPALFGHNHPRIRAAIAAALANGTSFGTPGPLEVEMAETLAALVPSLEMVRLCNSGTEATMSCIRLARGFTGRDKILKFSGCYHGHVDALLVKAGSGALTLGHPDSAGIPAATAADTIVLPFNDLAAVDAAFAAWPGQIAAVILEPYPANVGLILPDPGFLAALRDRCTRAGAVLIFDEVMTGFRLAPGGVQEISGVRPDLTALGKIIGGGLPVGAFGGRRAIMEKLAPLGPVYQAGTLSGNPLAVAAGLAALALIREQPPYAALDAAGQKLAAALRAAAAQKGLPLQVLQTGSMFALFFTDKPVRDYAAALASDAARFRQIFHFALDRGVYLPPSPYETCFISTAHDPAALDRTAEILAAAIAAL
ncbi:MAG: glutamate-1-semialdehyde 2,1-aminomutase [Opitutales bacterium]|jgi:glutamate-1-semialdehyde 2,1-aminomutase